MQKTFVGILFLVLAVVIFSLDNSKIISINFWLWELESNLALVLMVSIFFGAFASLLFSLPYRAKMKREIKKCNKTIKELKEKIIEHENREAIPADKRSNDLQLERK